MLDFIAQRLTPIFTSMGASPADVVTCVHSSANNIYALLAVLAMVIAVMIAAHWFARKDIIPFDKIQSFFEANLK